MLVALFTKSFPRGAKHSDKCGFQGIFTPGVMLTTKRVVFN